MGSPPRQPCHASTDITFRWVTPLLKRGAAQALQEADLLLLPGAVAGELGPNLSTSVNARLAELLESKSLPAALWALVDQEVLVSGLLQGLYASCQVLRAALHRIALPAGDAARAVQLHACPVCVRAACLLCCLDLTHTRTRIASWRRRCWLSGSSSRSRRPARRAATTTGAWPAAGLCSP